MPARLAAIHLCAWSCLPACVEAPRLGEAFRTQHFSYAIEEGVPLPCAETALWLERYYAAFSAFLGAGEETHIAYRRYKDRRSLNAATGCPPSAAGCTSGGIVSTTAAIFAHELVHAIASSVGEPPLFIREGLAEVLGGEFTQEADARPVAPDPLLRELTSSVRFAEHRRERGVGVYALAASFVRFLIDRFGRDRFVQLYRAAHEDADAKALDGAFRQALGVPFEEVFLAWLGEPPRPAGDARLWLAECAVGSELTLPSKITVGPGCGRFGWTDQNHALVTWTVDEPPARLRIRSAGDYGVTFVRCDGGSASGETYGIGLAGAQREQGSTFVIDVPRGRYLAEIAGSSEAAVEVEMLPPNHDPIPANACAEGVMSAPALTRADDMFLIQRWTSPHGWWIPVHEDGRVLLLQRGRPTFPSSFSACIPPGTKVDDHVPFFPPGDSGFFVSGVAAGNFSTIAVELLPAP